jgi:hypothetical protein
LTTAGDTNTGIFFPAADTIAFAEGGAEAARIDSSGNLLVGAASAAAGKLVVKDTASSNHVWLVGRTSDGASSVSFRNAADSAYNARLEAVSGYLAIETNGSERARIDSSGNLGLNVTPSAWSVITALQVKNAFIGGLTNNAYFGVNMYYNGTNYIYQATGFASLYFQSNGQHQWFTAPSGTAGNTISLTQAMTLEANGNLMVGTTGNAARLRVLSTASQSNGFYVTHPTSAQDVISCENSATSGNNMFIQFYTDATVSRGSIAYNRATGQTAYQITSDYRAKDINGPVTNSGALIDSIPVYMGKMKWAEQERPMFLAHETPAYAHTGEKDAVDKDGKPVYQQMDASALIPVMWAEIQSLRQRLAAANL